MNTTPDWSQKVQKFLYTLSVKIIDNSHFSIEERCNCFDCYKILNWILNYALNKYTIMVVIWRESIFTIYCD